MSRSTRRCCRSPMKTAPTSTTIRYFGAQSHGPRTRCLRFVTTVTRVLPYGHARLASGSRPPCLTGRDFHPRVAMKGFECYGSPPSPSFARRTFTSLLDFVDFDGSQIVVGVEALRDDAGVVDAHANGIRAGARGAPHVRKEAPRGVVVARLAHAHRSERAIAIA